MQDNFDDSEKGTYGQQLTTDQKQKQNKKNKKKTKKQKPGKYKIEAQDLLVSCKRC